MKPGEIYRLRWPVMPFSRNELVAVVQIAEDAENRVLVKSTEDETQGWLYMDDLAMPLEGQS